MSNFDGDPRTDLAVWRPSDGTWSVLTSDTGWTTGFDRRFGKAGDVPLAGDYTGDGKDDIAIWRPDEGSWTVRTSESGWTAGFVRYLGREGFFGPWIRVPSPVSSTGFPGAAAGRGLECRPA